MPSLVVRCNSRQSTACCVPVISVVAALVLALGVPPVQARTFTPGTARARWSIKTSVPAGADLKTPRNVAIGRLIALADAPGVTSQDSRFTTMRIPGALDGLHEGDVIQTRGYVHVVAQDDDGDYHIQMTGSRTSGNNCLIVELPLGKAAFEKDPKLRSIAVKLRAFLRDTLLHKPGKEFGAGGNWIGGRAYMAVTGQLFFDDWHVGGEPRGKSPNGHKGKAATLWEIHPITDIRFAPKPH